MNYSLAQKYFGKWKNPIVQPEPIGEMIQRLEETPESMSARKQDAKTSPAEAEYKNEGEITHLETICEPAYKMVI